MNLMKSLSLMVVILAFGSVLSCVDADPQIAKPPKGVIPVKEAKLLDRTYTDTRYNLISEKLGFKDNRSSWWSIEDLEDYIAYAKSQASEKGYQVDGLRVYMGAYPKSYSRPEVAGFTTLFIVPTGTPSTQESSLNLFANFQESTDLDVPPLNMGHSRTPPSAGYE